MIALNSTVMAILVTSGLLMGLCTVASAQSGASRSTASIYSCVDQHGRKLTSDRPIPECVDREQRELSPSGAVRRVIGPTLTDHERAAVDVQRRKAQEESNRLVEERRRERVLAARYPDQATHDIEREAALAHVDAVSDAAAKRIIDLREQRKALEQEMEFYRRDPAKVPVKLRRQLAENDEGVQEQHRFLAAQEQEKRRVNRRFDIELVQLTRLWAAQNQPAVAVPAPSAEPASPSR